MPGTPAAQVQGPLLDVLPGREHLIGGQFPADHPGAAGLLPERPHGRVPAAGVFPPLSRVGSSWRTSRCAAERSFP